MSVYVCIPIPAYTNTYKLSVATRMLKLKLQKCVWFAVQEHTSVDVGDQLMAPVPIKTRVIEFSVMTAWLVV